MGSRAESSLGSSGGANNHEIPARGRIELRMGDLRMDTRELASLFSQESTMPHLVGVVPHRVSEGERLRVETQYPGLSLITATAGDVRKYYTKNRGQILIVSPHPKREGKLSGAVVVQRGNPGVLIGNISKLVVDENERGQGIGPELVRAANALIFGHLNLGEATATVVINVPNDHIPQKILRNEGFKSQNQRDGVCISWDTETGRLKVRDALPFALARDAYLRRANAAGEIERYLSVLQVTPKIA